MLRPSLDSTVAKDTSQVIDRVVDGEVLLIHLQSGNYFSLNSVGTRIWEMLDGSNTIREIAGVITSEYDVEAERAEADVLQLATDLIDEGLAAAV